MNAAPEALRQLLANTEALLLDFDGPVCSVFAGLPAPFVVDQLCLVLADGGHGDPPPEIEKSADPFDVLKYAATLGDAEARFINAALAAHEVEAIATAEPTRGAHEFICDWSKTGRPLAIVSNNSSLAIEAYLDRYDLRRHVTAISGRTSSDPDLLKPSPHLLRLALTALGVSPSRSTLVGDSVTDIEAAAAAGVWSIGYANREPKLARLAVARANLVIVDMLELTQSVTGH